ncbi:uncharacterized protein LOC132743615 [Ruditapes philippinarum]|uniref:uncharacterized protein LOC132743615 n=1 Tax=Ruditapes philippinarum TaxID=129788 RepID=UPI00295A819E|nr:uncharacterized protein LOC132743615 [Ruditapes philippinarum]
MASQMTFLLSVLCILYLHGSGVSALDCYSCTNCNDPFKASGVSTMSCSISCMKIKGERDGNQFVLRSCGTLDVDKCEKQKYEGVDVEACMCKGNLCNGADDIKMRLTLPIICAIVLAMARKLIF